MQLHQILFYASAVFAAIGLWQVFVKKVPVSSFVNGAWGGLLFFAYILK